MNDKLKRGKLYPGEFPHGKDSPQFVWDGEPARMIQPGEYYFSGAEITAYYYPGSDGSTTGPYHPATRVNVIPCPYCRGCGKVREPREK